MNNHIAVCLFMYYLLLPQVYTTKVLPHFPFFLAICVHVSPQVQLMNLGRAILVMHVKVTLMTLVVKFTGTCTLLPILSTLQCILYPYKLSLRWGGHEPLSVRHLVG